MQKTQLEVISLAAGAGGILLVSLMPMGEPLNYLAGQFITLLFHKDGREIRRSYSLLSSPLIDEPLSIAIKLVENGEISRFLHHQLSVGDRLETIGPNGQFVYKRAKEARTLFLFGAGVGITPLFSILKTALLAEPQSQVVLVYSNRSKESTLFFAELENWKERYPDRLEVIHLWSNSKNLMRARLNGFLIADLVKRYLQFERNNAEFYLCGPIDYMDVCRFTLLGQGYKPEQIKRETFLPPENDADDDDLSEKVVDTNTYRVNIDYFGQKHQIAVPFDQRILQVALAEGIALPYSCAGGVCSTCIAQCTKGGVRMDYNEVLAEQEIAEGKVLVCTGHPTQNDTTIVWQ